MDYLLKLYKTAFRLELKQYGFIPYQKAFFRVKNDVVQKIVLNKNRFAFNVEYGILPLSYPVDEPACLHGGRYIVGNGFPNPVAWQVFGENTPENIEPVLDEILYILKRETLPFFDRAIDCSRAYPEIIKLENEVFSEIILNDYVKVCLCIKNSDFENAKIHMTSIISQNEDAIRSNILNLEKNGDLRLLAEYKSRALPILEQNIAELDRILIPDIEFFKMKIENNEIRSREFLKNLGSKTRKS